MESFMKRALKAAITLSAIFFNTEASVLIIPAGDAMPKAYPATGVNLASDSLENFFRQSAPRAFTRNQGAVISSHAPWNATDNLRPSSDSFFRGAIEAWGLHQHLVVRPDEIWFTILVQMSFYMSNTHNAEALRDVFVSHKGQKEIEFSEMDKTKALAKFRHAIQAQVKTPWLMDWIVPNHTTTLEADVMVSNVLMMGLMKAYFSYSIAAPVCGLPSVTLLGVKSDYERIREKVKMLSKFGEEPAQYQKRLLPIMDRFVRSFDEPSSADIRTFWNSIITTNVVPGQRMVCSAGPARWEISGWITGFHYWDEEGIVLGNMGSPKYSLDDVQYPIRDQDRIPVGYSKVHVILRNIGDIGVKPTNSTVVAGAIGKRIVHGAPTGYFEALAELNSTLLASLKSSPMTIHSQLQPTSAWLMYAPQRGSDKDSERESMMGGDPERQTMKQFMQCPKNVAPFDSNTDQTEYD